VIVISCNEWPPSSAEILFIANVDDFYLRKLPGFIPTPNFPEKLNSRGICGRRAVAKDGDEIRILQMVSERIPLRLDE